MLKFPNGPQPSPPGLSFFANIPGLDFQEGCEGEQVRFLACGCALCVTLCKQKQLTYLCISWFGDLSREILAYVFSPALLFSSELLAMCIFLKWEHLKQAGREHDMS